jgi:hypothetical protein
MKFETFSAHIMQNAVSFGLSVTKSEGYSLRMLSRYAAQTLE